MTDQTALFEAAQKVIVGGVNSPVRAFGAVGGTPLFIQSAKGATVTDASGKTYVDYVGSWGPMILGHSHPAVLEAVKATAERGLSFGAPCTLETELAERICSLMPSIEQIRMVNSGTEATMSAIRLARGFTKRNKFIKFAGNYHGHSDSLLVQAGSGALTFGVPSSAGVPQAVVQDTLVAEFNDLGSVEALFKANEGEVAALIVEPVAGNMGCIPPLPAFLPGLRKLCDEAGALLIMDEVMTGFRVSLRGAQDRYQVKPDLTTLGKIVGGGMPVGAFGGRREVMVYLAPLGPVYQAGTLSGNPMAMAAGIANLDILMKADYAALEATTTKLLSGWQTLADKAGVPFSTQQVGSMFGIYFRDTAPITVAEVMEGNSEHFNAFFHGLLEAGVAIAPSAYESGFVSFAHGEAELSKSFEAAEQAFSDLK